MKDTTNQQDANAPQNNPAAKNDFPGYPQYPAGQDIYARAHEEDLDPEDLTKQKDSVDSPFAEVNEKSFNKDKSGSDLDIPGAELDDADEAIGEEDEENNYYSLGGDNHENQEEYKGE